jgi:hypothetical protein
MNGIHVHLTPGQRHRREKAGRYGGERLVKNERGHLIPDTPHEPTFVAECHLADLRMHAVRSHEEIDGFGRLVAQRHVHLALVLLEECHCCAEADYLWTVESSVEHAFELATEKIEVTIVKEPTPERQVRNGEPFPAAGVDERELLYWVMDTGEVGDQPKPFGCVVTRPEEVDHVAIVANARRALGHDDLVTATSQTDCER